MSSNRKASDDIKNPENHGAMPDIEELDYTPVPSFDSEDLACIADHLLRLSQLSHFLDILLNDSNELQNMIKLIQIIKQTAGSMGVWVSYKLCQIYSNDIGDFVELHQQSSHPTAHIMLHVKTEIDIGISLYGERLNSFGGKYDQLIRGSSPKMRALLLKLHENETIDKEPLCGIVFVKEKKEALLLSLWLKEIAESNPLFGFLKVDYVVGRSSRLVLTQEEVLTKFRNHELNLLISTSVLEEEHDLPPCNLVIRYEFPATIRNYLLSKGKASTEGSKYIILCSNDEKERAKEKANLEYFKQLELMPSQGDISQNLLHSDDDVHINDGDLIGPLI